MHTVFLPFLHRLCVFNVNRAHRAASRRTATAHTRCERALCHRHRAVSRAAKLHATQRKHGDQPDASSRSRTSDHTLRAHKLRAASCRQVKTQTPMQTQRASPRRAEKLNLDRFRLRARLRSPRHYYGKNRQRIPRALSHRPSRPVLLLARPVPVQVLRELRRDPRLAREGVHHAEVLLVAPGRIVVGVVLVVVRPVLLVVGAPARAVAVGAAVVLVVGRELVGRVVGAVVVFGCGEGGRRQFVVGFFREGVGR